MTCQWGYCTRDAILRILTFRREPSGARGEIIHNRRCCDEHRPMMLRPQPFVVSMPAALSEAA